MKNVIGYHFVNIFKTKGEYIVYIKVFLLFITINLTSLSLNDIWRVPSKYQTYKYEDFFKEVEDLDKKITEKIQEVDKLVEDNSSPMQWSYEKKSLYLRLIQEITELENKSNTLVSKHNAIQFLSNE